MDHLKVLWHPTESISWNGGLPSFGIWELIGHQMRIREDLTITMVPEVSAVVNIASGHGVASEIAVYGIDEPFRFVL